MKVEEEVLKKILSEAIFDANKKKPTSDKFKELMYNMFNITSGEAAYILNGKTSVDLMQKDTLYKTTKVLYELNNRVNATYDKDKLDVDKYFTEDEKYLYGKKLDRNKQDKDIVIKAGNWMKVTDDQYVIKIYPDELMSDYISRDKINYNPDTQRYLTTVRNKDGDERQIITFDKDACNNISENMAHDLYISDMLALNINPDFNMPPKVVNGDVVIPNESPLDCIDGWHRLRAAVNTKMRKADWDQPLLFFLFICDVQKACRYILQQDEKIHLSKEQTEKSDETNAVNFIIKKLNDDVNFILRNTLYDDKDTVIRKTITKVFNPNKLYTQEDRQEAVKIYQNIKNNINDYIETNDLFGKEVTKEMWFIFINTIKHCIDNNLDFLQTMSKLNVEKLISLMNFTKTPSDTHYKSMKEALENV